MSTRLTKALEFANYRITINNQQAQLKAKTQNLLSYSINGGTFTIDIYDEIHSRYFEVTNDYYVEYEKLRKARKVHKVLDLNEKGK